MVRFAFEAVDKTGAVVRGHIDAQARSVAVDQLISAGQTPLSVAEFSGESQPFLGLWSALRTRRVDLLVFVRELSILVGAGLPVERALGVMGGLATNRTTEHMIGQILTELRAGQPLSRAVRPIIPDGASHIEHLLAAGEASGHLAAVLERLTRNLQRAKLLRDRLISSLTYPAFLVVTLVAVLWVVFTEVLPRLAPTFAEAKASLPLPTLVLLRVSEFLQSYGLLLLAALFATLLGGIYALRRENVRLALDRLLFTSPVVLRVPFEYEAARFCRNLETLLGGGLSLDRALRAARSAAVNRWFKREIGGALEMIESGASLRVAFAQSAVIPSLVAEFAAVGEETGRLAAMLGEAAQVLEHDVETRLDRLTTLVLPIATLVMGLIVAGVMAAVVTGLLAVNDLAL